MQSDLDAVAIHLRKHRFTPDDRIVMDDMIFNAIDRFGLFAGLVETCLVAVRQLAAKKSFRHAEAVLAVVHGLPDNPFDLRGWDVTAYSEDVYGPFWQNLSIPRAIKGDVNREYFKLIEYWKQRYFDLLPPQGRHIPPDA